VDTLRKLITRDCPIRNAGPCPKVKPVEVPDCTCICPAVECSSVATSTSISTTATTTLSTTTAAPPCVCPTPALTTPSSCESDLIACQNSLTFTGTSKAGAQGARDALSKQLEDLGVELSNLNLTKIYYHNRSIDLGDELLECLKNSGNYSDLFWVIKAQLDDDVNATGLWLS
jgi:hypothetical protein